MEDTGAFVTISQKEYTELLRCKEIVDNSDNDGVLELLAFDPDNPDQEWDDFPDLFSDEFEEFFSEEEDPDDE